jgi:hypothetical protein
MNKSVLATLVLTLLAGTQSVAQQSQKPNGVFIVAGNVGYGDPGPYGGGEYYAADYRLERRAYRYTHRLSDYPYYRGYTSVDPWWPGSGGRCGFGSYVACVNTGAFCWRRCY